MTHYTDDIVCDRCHAVIGWVAWCGHDNREKTLCLDCIKRELSKDE